MSAVKPVRAGVVTTGATGTGAGAGIRPARAVPGIVNVNEGILRVTVMLGATVGTTGRTGVVTAGTVVVGTRLGSKVKSPPPGVAPVPPIPPKSVVAVGSSTAALLKVGKV
ncbi:MAG: hypothetical protein ACMUIA_11635 [bacterium]